MPINSLKNLRSFPKLGDFHKGAIMVESKDDPSKTRPGKDLDFFRVKMRKEYESLQKDFDTLYGANPVEFHNVFLDGDSVDDAFDYWMIERTATKVLHKCDEVTQAQRWDAKSTSYVSDGAACVKNTTGCDCKRKGVLKILLPDFIAITGVWGYFAVHTGSFYDIVNIAGYLNRLYALHGSLSGMPYILSRVEQSIIVPKGKSGDKIHKDSHLIHLIIDPGITQNLLANRFTQSAYQIRDGLVDTQTGETKALGAGVDDFEDTDDSPAYDLDRVNELTSHLFKAPLHQDNAIKGLIASGKITDKMTTQDVVKAIVANRRDREDERFNDGTFWTDEELVKRFVSEVNQVTRLSATEILKALNYVFKDEPRQGFKQFKGMSKSRAWALVVLYQDEWNFESAKASIDPASPIWAQICILEQESNKVVDYPF
jgi:hypothetical protein